MPWSFVSLLVGCSDLDVLVGRQRVHEMRDHTVDTRAARDAIARGDLAEARAAGQRLSDRDLVPGIGSETKSWLFAVRRGGRDLADDTDLVSAAATLVAITVDCAACHRAMSVTPIGPSTGPARDFAWAGLVFESDELWRPVWPDPVRPSRTWRPRRPGPIAAHGTRSSSPARGWRRPRGSRRRPHGSDP